MFKEINWDNVEFKDNKKFLSNMYQCNITIDGINYPSSENFYMSSKFIGVDEKLVKLLSSCPPIKSKIIANKNKQLIRSDWDDIKLHVMTTALMAKFSQNSDLKQLLLDTKNEHLEERNDWNDTFWGTCNGVGENNLGKIFMNIRSLLRNQL